jgi:hypothetical protein
MGLFRRRRRERSAEGVAAGRPPADGGWAAAGPVQRVLTAPRLTAERDFAGSLATQQRLSFTAGLVQLVLASCRD